MRQKQDSRKPDRRTRNIEGFTYEQGYIEQMVEETPGLVFEKKPVGTLPVGIAFAKNDKGAALRDEFNQYLAKAKADGTFEEIEKNWTGNDAPCVPVDRKSLAGNTPILKLATTGDAMPYCFYSNGKMGGSGDDRSFFESLKESFIKTFIREDRWKMVLDGIGVTMYISIFATFFGTFLGFGVCMLRRSKSRIVFNTTGAFIRVLQGTALALGYTKAKAFLKIVFPQAVNNFLPVKKEYPSVTPLEDINAIINEGEIISVIGPSGTEGNPMDTMSDLSRMIVENKTQSIDYIMEENGEYKNRLDMSMRAYTTT